MGIKVLRETTKCTKPNCKGSCFTDVVVGGWDRSRPGGIPHCRDCNKRYPEPDVATKSRFAGAYGLRYSTTRADNGQAVGGPIGGGQDGGSGRGPTWVSTATPRSSATRKPLQGGQGSLRKPAPGPWSPEQKLQRALQEKEKENEELKKKLASKETG